MSYRRSNRPALVLYLPLAILLLAVLLISIRFGAVAITNSDIFSCLTKKVSGSETLNLTERIFFEIRLPRAILSVFVGATLAVGGVLLQALFRNPIVEPGLVGTSSGAAFGAALYFVFGSLLQFGTGEWTLPIAACLGAIGATTIVFILSESKEDTTRSITTLLLIGIAINALCLSGVGFLSYLSRDPQARSITFWNLGTLSGANWHSVLIVGLTTTIGIGIALRYAKDLNALALGENEAMMLGIDVKRLKLIILALNVIMVAVATAFTGVIAFVGLVVPHLIRLLRGSNTRFLIVAGAMLGAIQLTGADLLARLALQPAELPIGIVTSVVGVPVFIILLRRRAYRI